MPVEQMLMAGARHPRETYGKWTFCKVNRKLYLLAETAPAVATRCAGRAGREPADQYWRTRLQLSGAVL